MRGLLCMVERIINSRDSCPEQQYTDKPQSIYEGDITNALQGCSIRNFHVLKVMVKCLPN